ncbi:MAG: divalent-cation tolerance protein CutA [Beijerinckiaceae bacterium]
MANAYAIVLTTCDDRALAKLIARTLVEKRLAACVQILPIDSVYAWAGQLQESAELLLLCKIKRADYADIEQAIRAIHTYETPEIVEIAIEAGSADYLAWIDQVTR